LGSRLSHKKSAMVWNPAE